MKPRYYISSLIIILTLLGAVSQQHITLPNQEVVLQFKDVDVTKDDIKNTIAIVKKQLQDIGVSNIQVKEDESGILKITYYSDSDIESIKNIFSKDRKLDINLVSHNQSDNSKSFPFDENIISYNLDVYEIQNGHDIDWDLEGTFVLELDSKSDRFFEPNLYITNSVINLDKLGITAKEALKVSKNIAIAIHNTSHKIPESRAGPLS